jgi:hypothetical protein
LRKEEHPWYKPEQHTRMDVAIASRGTGFRFETRPNTPIDPTEDPRHGGLAKAQWLHASTRDLAVDPQAGYVLRLDLTGRAGLLRIRVQGAARTEDRRKIEFAQCMVAFPREETDQRRTVVLHPCAFLGDSPAGERNSLRAQLHVLWRPDADDAHLAGEATLASVEMQP